MTRKEIQEWRLQSYRHRKLVWWSVLFGAVSCTAILMLGIAGGVAVVVLCGALLISYTVFVGQNPLEREDQRITVLSAEQSGGSVGL